MTRLVTATTIDEAWRDAFTLLRSDGPEIHNLIVVAEKPFPPRVTSDISSAVDEFLISRALQSVRTVANTIFPAALARTVDDRSALYTRYADLLPRLRRLRGNKRGTYFGRLIKYPLQEDETKANQVETVIGDLTQQLVRRKPGQGPLRSVYEAQIFAPGKDRLPQGFPCMSSLSFQLDDSSLRLTATYRNQYYVERALGNLLGLAELQHFVASAAGLTQGPLCIHAFRAQIDPGIGRRDIENLGVSIAADL